MTIITRVNNLFNRQFAKTQIRNSGSFYAQKNVEGFDKNFKEQLKMTSPVGKTWRWVFFIGAVPCTLGAVWIAWKDHKISHSKPREEFIEYPHFNVRNKPFPWGDGNHSFFHNPETNWVPGVGYEKEPSHH